MTYQCRHDTQSLTGCCSLRQSNLETSTSSLDVAVGLEGLVCSSACRHQRYTPSQTIAQVFPLTLEVDDFARDGSVSLETNSLVVSKNAMPASVTLRLGLKRSHHGASDR